VRLILPVLTGEKTEMECLQQLYNGDLVEYSSNVIELVTREKLDNLGS
jgi:hypothetical protein